MFLFVGEVGRALLHKRAHAFRLVVERKERVEEPPLKPQAVGQAQLVRGVDGFFGQRHDGLGKRRDVAGEGEGAGHEVRGGKDAGRQARAQRLRGKREKE